jgi:hypothetical protein
MGNPYRDEAEAMRREMRHKIDMAHREAIAKVCQGMATFYMQGALVTRNAAAFIEMMDASLLWQTRAALAHAGIDPMAVTTPEGER